MDLRYEFWQGFEIRNSVTGARRSLLAIPISRCVYFSCLALLTLLAYPFGNGFWAQVEPLKILDSCIPRHLDSETPRSETPRSDVPRLLDRQPSNELASSVIVARRSSLAIPKSRHAYFTYVNFAYFLYLPTRLETVLGLKHIP